MNDDWVISSKKDKIHHAFSFRKIFNFAKRHTSIISQYVGIFKLPRYDKFPKNGNRFPKYENFS